MRTLTLAGTFLVCLALALGGRAQEDKAVQRLDGSTIGASEIDATVARLIKAGEVTGLEIAILNQGEIVYSKGYGFRDIEKHLPMTTGTVLSAASFTKAAFAYMVMQLVEEGKIDLDKPVYEYFPKPLPQYEDYADLAGDPRYKKITARMLLSHTSGFPNWRRFEDDQKLKIHFEPGTRYAYSGEGIDLLQFVVETVTKTPLEALMQKRVFGPLGMKHSSMVWEEHFESDFANGYDEYGRSLGPKRRRHADAAGSLTTTAGDYALLLRAILRGEGLSAKTKAQMLSQQVAITSKHQVPTFNEETTESNKKIRLSYGLGWGLYWSPHGEAFFKEGHDEGWRNYAVAFDKQKSGIVIMANSSNGEGIFQELLETLLRDTFTPIEWEGYTPYDKLPPRPALAPHTKVALDEKTLDRYPGRYTLAPGPTLTVLREGDHLAIREDGGGERELFAEGEKEFFSATDDSTVEFRVDAQGKATALVLRIHGKEFVLNRSD